MRKLIRTLVICGAAAVALASTAARADGHEFREHYGEGREQRGRGHEWREQRELDEQWRELANERERFYSSWHGNPWRRVRFERWYNHRRDELARRSGHERREELERREEHERDGRWRH